MATLRPLGELITVKPRPETTPSLKPALTKPEETVGNYYFTPSLIEHFKRIFETVIHGRGQGFWVQAEYGAGKTHFLAALGLLLGENTDRNWSHVKDATLRQEYAKPLAGNRLLLVPFSLKGMAETERESSLTRVVEQQIKDALPPAIRDKVDVTSDELAHTWWQTQANEAEKAGVAHHFQQKHHLSPDAYLKQVGKYKFGAEVRKSGITIALKGSYRERFFHVYKQVVSHGYTGILFILDEFRSWQDRHPEGSPEYAEDEDVLETLGYVLPVDEGAKIWAVVASQGDMPQKLSGAHEGDRFIQLPLLADRNRTDFGEIVAFRCRDLKPGAPIEVREYFDFHWKTFKFLKQTNTSKEYFQAIFPFQPRCFDVIRRITQNADRHNLPTARSAINMVWDALSLPEILRGNRLLVVSDLLQSEELLKGLRSEHYRTAFDAYELARDGLAETSLAEDQREFAARLVGTLFLQAIASPDRPMKAEELAEATLVHSADVAPADEVDAILVTLRQELSQIRYDKEKGARFETEARQVEFGKVFSPFKKSAKANTPAQDAKWLDSLFWDLADIGKEASEQGWTGGLFKDLGRRDASGSWLLPNTVGDRTTKLHRVQYEGVAIIARDWRPEFGQRLTDPGQHFRIVYLTRSQQIPQEDLAEPRMALCVPAGLSEECRETLADLVACDEMKKKFTGPADEEVHFKIEERRKRAALELLKHQVATYRQGQIVTQKSLGIPPADIFAGQRVREDSLASRILDKTYDQPLFEPREFKKDLTAAEIPRVFRGLFYPTGEQATADRAAREQYGPGLELVAKGNLTEFNAAASQAIKRIRSLLATKGEMSLADLARDLCREPWGLTEEMVWLYALALVREGGSPAYQLALGAAGREYRLRAGNPPAGNCLKAATIHEVVWDTRFRAALAGARIVPSKDIDWNSVVEWVQVLRPDAKTVANKAEEPARNAELLKDLAKLADELPQVRENASLVAKRLNAVLDRETADAFDRMVTVVEATDFGDFQERARTAFDTLDAFRAGWARIERARALADRASVIDAVRAYLDGATHLADPQVVGTRDLVEVHLKYANLSRDPTLVEKTLKSAFADFQDRYIHAYRKFHRIYHTAAERLSADLSRYDGRLATLRRLNALDLGASEGIGLDGRLAALKSRLVACPKIDEAPVEDVPVCPECRLTADQALPETEARAVMAAIDRAIEGLIQRLRQETIRKILESSAEFGVTELLKVIQAAQAERLADVLDDNLVERIKSLLQDARLVRLDLPVTDLFDGIAGIEEGEVGKVLSMVKERLTARFAGAKQANPDKRILFLLKGPEKGDQEPTPPPTDFGDKRMPRKKPRVKVEGWLKPYHIENLEEEIRKLREETWKHVEEENQDA